MEGEVSGHSDQHPKEGLVLSGHSQHLLPGEAPETRTPLTSSLCMYEHLPYAKAHKATDTHTVGVHLMQGLLTLENAFWGARTSPARHDSPVALPPPDVSDSGLRHEEIGTLYLSIGLTVFSLSQVQRRSRAWDW